MSIAIGEDHVALLDSVRRFTADRCPPAAVRAAVWLHGRAGELGAADLTEQCLIATDLLRFLPQAIRECQTINGPAPA